MRTPLLLALLAAPALATDADFTSQAVPAYRGEVGARYDVFDQNFTSAFGGTNAPDVGLGFELADFVQHHPGAILLGNDYIYALSGPTDYTLALHNELPLAEVSLQLRVEGIPLDNSTVALRWSDASGTPYTLAPTSTIALNPADPNEQQFIWDPIALGGLGITDAELVFMASGAHMGLDVIIVDHRVEHDGLVGDADQLSLSSGGVQALEIDAGAAHAGDLYFVVGSLHGSSPGTPYAGLTLPINFDFYTLTTINQANTGFFQNTVGFLDNHGIGHAALSLPAGSAPSLAGLHAEHAAVLFDPVSLAPLANTGPEGVDLVL